MNFCSGYGTEWIVLFTAALIFNKRFWRFLRFSWIFLNFWELDKIFEMGEMDTFCDFCDFFAIQLNWMKIRENIDFSRIFVSFLDFCSFSNEFSDSPMAETITFLVTLNGSFPLIITLKPNRVLPILCRYFVSFSWFCGFYVCHLKNSIRNERNQKNWENPLKPTREQNQQNSYLIWAFTTFKLYDLNHIDYVMLYNCCRQTFSVKRPWLSVEGNMNPIFLAKQLYYQLYTHIHIHTSNYYIWNEWKMRNLK